MYFIYYLVHYFQYKQKFGSQVLYRYLGFFIISSSIYEFNYHTTVVHVALFFPKIFGGHLLYCTLYIHPLLIYTSPWPSLPLRHLAILVSAIKFLVL